MTTVNVFHQFSHVLSLIIPGSILFRKYEYKSEEDEAKGKAITFRLMLVEFGITLLMVPCFCFLRTKAPTPPSALANTDKPIKVLSALKELFKNTNFILAFISFSIFFGFMKAFNIILPYMLNPFNFNSNVKAIAGK
jgi:Na+/melibiose symporter-like transporter